MRKGFSAALATVAFAMLGTHAMALAPVISEIPDIIVGDAEETSAANVFVFPDAFNLDVVVSDDETSDGGIIWSYWIGGAGGVYRINDTDVVDPSLATNLINPPSAQRIELNSDPADIDANPRTITIRDIMRSPLPAQASYPDPAGGATEPDTAILPESRVITLYASDGSTVSLDNARSFIVYSEDNGFDAFSGGTVETQVFFEGNPGINWNSAEDIPGLGTTATVQESGGDACFTVAEPPAGGDTDKVNLYRWYSDYGAVQLTPNTVFEARLQVTTTKTTADNSTPMWTWLWDNISHDGTQGRNEYTGEVNFLDNENGGNSPISGPGRSDFEVWMMPVQGQTPQFLDSTNGFFRPDNIDDAHMRLNFRLFDNGAGGFGSEFDHGTVCLDSVEVISHDLLSMQVQETVYDVSTIVDPDPLEAGSWGVEALSDASQGTDTDYTGGNLTVTPQSTWTLPTLVNITPGDAIQGPIDADPSVIDDNWPIAWESNELFYIEVLMSAPTDSDEQNPPDVIKVGADVPTTELIMMNSMAPSTRDGSLPNTDPVGLRGVSTPRNAAAQTYGAFFYTHNKTLSGLGDDVAIWRPRVQILTTDDLSFWGRTDNTGGITIHSVKVQKVTF